VRILIFGYGKVGKELRALIHERRGEVPELSDVQIVATVTRRGISFGDRDAFVADEPFSLDHLERLKPDVVIDTASANYETGEPSLSLYFRAFELGASVITTNKAPLALRFWDIVERARKHGVTLGFQGTVMSGTPSVNLLRVLPGSWVRKIRGILNGTTNYILSRMAEGIPFASALAEAKQKGYAEEDPTLDLNGFDAGAKLVILSNFAMKTKLTVRDVKLEGIANLKEEEVANALGEGKKPKLVAQSDGKEATVRVQLVSQSDPLYSVDGVENALSVETDVQTITIRGPGAGPRQAAYGALSDLILLKRGALLLP
jgi:homoserine dehydrogenase (EC 1.1.1.3)